MADHDELVAEIPILETMGTQERQKLAKKRRLQQLKRWSQREKEWIAKEKQLNKRLANIMSEENNGLNLKQYTTYNSNQRTKKRLLNNNILSSGNTKHELHQANLRIGNGVSKNEFNNNSTIIGPFSNSLQPNGRVHFNVGVMLLEAAARNDYDEVKRLLSLGASPDSVNHDGLTALHQCCIDASEPIMRLLLDYGANVDARDTEQWTPLHAACTCGHLNLVKILVEHNADLLAVNGDGNMPFDICEDEATLDYIESQMVKQGITQEMIDLTRASNELNMLNDLKELAARHPADLNQAVDEQGVTRLHIAATNNYLSVVKFMLNHGVNVNVCDNDQWQPLHGIACWGNEQHMKIVELLVEAGANLDARTLNDETVFDLCDNVELLERLNQLKDELESRQATGTGRLKRTQSRTNSRVHSVRRTSVRDKNQISRREAREEAMLRVDSNTETPALVETEHQQQQEQEAASNMQVNGDRSSDHTSGAQKALQDRFIERLGLVQPKVTNLDEPDGLSTDLNIMNRHVECSQIMERSQRNDQMTNGGSASKVNLNDFMDKPETIGSKPMEPDVVKEQPPECKSQMQSTAVKVTVTHQQHDENKFAQNQACDRTTTTTNQQQQRQQSTSTVHVQFAPTNYTLSNLKKHRSDLRMRSCSIGGGTSSTSLNNTDEISAISSSKPSINGIVIKTPALIDTTNEAIRFDPEPMGATGGSLLSQLEETNSNGGLLRPESPSSNIRKFHGQPSEVLGSESARKMHHKCCVII